MAEGTSSPSPNSRSISHGIGLDGSPARAPESRWAGPHNLPGTIGTSKGYLFCLRLPGFCAPEDRVFELLVIGDGPERDELQQLAQKLKITAFVRFAGKIDAADLDQAFTPGSIVVVPSLGGEVFRLLSAAESMSRGLPVVHIKSGSFAEFVGDAGLLFKVGDAKDLSRQIKCLLDNGELAASLGDRAQKRARESYPHGVMVIAHADLYREIGGAERT